MQSPDGNQLWCPGQTLWSLIAEHVSKSELPKIYTALGHSLVDMCTEVHTEAAMWHKMWQESQRGGKCSSRAGTPFPRQQGSPLPDPPAVKELLRAEVKMLLQTLRERASRGERAVEKLLHRYKPETVNYALSYQDSCTNCANFEDTDNRSRPGSRCSVQSSIEDEIEAIRDQLSVTEIDHVVDQLRSVLIRECEELTTLVKLLKANIKQKYHSELNFEPSITDLRELRGALQMDLELYPALFTSFSPLPGKADFRLPAGRSSESLLILTPTSVLRPHPPPLVSRPKPRPPVGPSLTNTPLHRTYGQRRITSPSNKSTKTPTYSSTYTAGHASSPLTTDHIMVKNKYQCGFLPEQDNAGLYCRTLDSSPNIEIKSERNSPSHKTHLSINHSIHSPSTECDLLPQRERKSSPAWRRRDINITRSPFSAPSGHCDAGSNSTDQHLATKQKSVTQNRQQYSSCEAILDSVKAQTCPGIRMNTSESSVMSETVKTAKNTRSKSNNEITRNSSAPLKKDVKQQQSPVNQDAADCSSHPSAACSQGPSANINGQFFTSPTKPHGAPQISQKLLKNQQGCRFFTGFSQSLLLECKLEDNN